jgi:putative endonuclease
MVYTTYILKSIKDGKYYYGHTEQIDVRLKQHNSGRVRSTKSRVPFAIHYTEIFNTKSEAFVREQFFKSLDGRNWLKLKGII